MLIIKLSVASVGWYLSQKTYLFLLGQTRATGVQGTVAFSLPSPQQADFTSVKPGKKMIKRITISVWTRLLLKIWDWSEKIL